MTAPDFLAKRAVLARLSISTWSGRKNDDVVTEDIAERYQTEGNIGRFNKSLLTSKDLYAITSATNEARQAHRMHTLPWLDDGSRLLPIINVPTYNRAMRDIETKFNTAVEVFINNYPTIVKASIKRLGDLYKAEEYPDKVEAMKRFSFSTHISPVPTSADFRVRVSADIRADVEKQTKIALQAAMNNVVERMVNSVERFSNKLKRFEPNRVKGTKKGVFRDSITDHISELIDIIPSLNIMDDEKIDTMIERMEKELLADTKVLRHDAAVRKRTIHSADDIVNKLKQYGAYRNEA